MEQALQLARSVKGQTSPNPPVGAVVVKDHAIVGMGAHLKAGGPHAEVYALQMAGDHALGGTIYVTLEPCSHTGRTSPCADLIIEAGVQRVVIGTRDVHEAVAGKGIEKLREAGIEVVENILQKEALEVNAQFFTYIHKKRPFITLKAAMSLDGKIATSSGDSQWITGSVARLDVHEDRHKHDTILVGIGTVIADDPLLTTRLPVGGRSPIRVVLDSRLRIQPTAQVIQDASVNTIIFTSKLAIGNELQKFKEFKHVEVIQLAEEKVELELVMQELFERGIMSVYVEGGATIHGAFLTADLFDEVIIYVAPKLIGGSKAPTIFGGKGFDLMKDVPELVFNLVAELGGDLKLVAKRK